MALLDCSTALADPARLAALRHTALLDTPSEEAFDRLTRLASRTLAVPVALVSLVDRDRQFFKSAVGLPEPLASRRGTSLDYSYCQYGLVSGRPLLIEDAREHPQVRDSLALSELGIIAYAGVPLTTPDGHVLGTLCAIDFVPRRWTAEQVAVLEDLGAVAMDEIELRAKHALELEARAARAAQAAAEAARARATFLAEASALLAEELDSDRPFARVAQHAVPFLADLCRLCTREEHPARPVHPLAVVHAAPLGASDAAALDPLARRVAHAGVRLGWPAYPEGAPGRLAAPREAEAALFEGLGLGRVLAVPLEVRGRPLGALVLATARGRGPSPLDDAEGVLLALTLAHRAALALEHRRLYRAARDAVRARDDFLSVASHELKTPLTPLQLGLASLERALPPELAPRAQVLQRQVRRVGELVDRLLDVARVTGGQLALERAPLELDALVADVAERFAEAARAAGCPLQLRVQPGVRGRWDRSRVEQILSNLVSNALRYGAGHPVEIALEADAEVARLSVRDEGRGIAPEHLAHVFDRFERAGAGRQYGGLGLGLYIARRLARAHGGDVVVQSRPGEGSTFTVVLPRTDAPAGLAPEADADAGA